MPALPSSDPVVPHTVWRVPGDPSAPALVYAVDARRRRVGVWLPPIVAALAAGAWLLGVPGLLASLVAGGVALAAVAWSLGGGTGYYELSRGTLGPWLGRRVPDLSGHERSRWHGGELRTTS